MIGSPIGNFRVIEKLGEGGMGVVFKALDVQLDRPVAIKMLNADLARNPELVQRFKSEARAQANLNHPNLATLYSFIIDQGNAFMVMEFVEGETFEQIIRRDGPMNPHNAVPWFKQALLGIGAAHRMGIIHRDIKPSNLMLNRQGMVKVMDFGIAKAVGARGMTRTGTQLGTLAYMSPEQIQNENVDVRSDIYALGVTLYEMLCGHVPFESGSDFRIMQDQVMTPPPPLTHYYSYAPREFEAVVAKALEKNPGDRFQTVEAFGAALEHPDRLAPATPPVVVAPPPRPPLSDSIRIAAAPSPAPPLPLKIAVPPPPKPSPRPVKWIIICAVAAILVVLLAVLLWPNESHGTSPPSAQMAPAPAPTPQPSLQQDSAETVIVTGGGEAQGATQTNNAPLIASASDFTGQFSGVVHNTSLNQSAEFGLVVRDDDGALSGCMIVVHPLYGSGPLTGFETGNRISFAVTSSIGRIDFVGSRQGAAIDGSYTVKHADGATEDGTFELRKAKPEGPARSFDTARCPTDAEVNK